MKMKHVLSAGFAMLTLGLVATTVQAAPVAALGGSTAVESDGAGLLQKATWYGRGYGYGYGHYQPYGYGYYKPYRWYRPYYGYGYGYGRGYGDGYGHYRHW